MTVSLPEVAGVRHDYVEANGLRFHVAEAGDRSADPIVLLHGWPQHWYMWRHVIPGLAQTYRVICPDLRGFGWSDAPRGGYEKETLAADVIGVMDAMGLDRVKLVGHDWGGYVGFLLALFYPERIDRFLALCIVHPWPQAKAGRLDLAARMAYQYILSSPAGPWLLRTQPSLIETALRSATRDKTTWSEEELKAFSTVLQEPERAAASSALYRTFLLREAIPLATGRYAGYRLQTPTLLLFARHDPAVPPSLAPGYEEHADDMEVRVVEDASHFIVDEQPELVLDEARRFFA